jgi:hypothetical protein
VVSFTSLPLYPPPPPLPGKEPLVPIGQEVGWAPESAWTLWRREKTLHCRESNQGRPARSPSVYRLSYHLFNTSTNIVLYSAVVTFTNFSCIHNADLSLEIYTHARTLAHSQSQTYTVVLTSIFNPRKNLIFSRKKEIQSYFLFRVAARIGTSKHFIELYPTIANTIFNFVMHAIISGPIIRSWFSLLVPLALEDFLNL